MTFLATTRVAVLRGTRVVMGETIDDNDADPVAGYEDLPASLIERGKSVYDPASSTYRTVRIVRGRLHGNVQLEDGDRIRDNRTGRIYAIDETVAVPRALSGQSSLSLDLRVTT